MALNNWIIFWLLAWPIERIWLTRLCCAQVLDKFDFCEDITASWNLGKYLMKYADKFQYTLGRLEVHMEIGLPDEHGRLQIIKIHTAKVITCRWTVSFLFCLYNHENMVTMTQSFYLFNVILCVLRGKKIIDAWKQYLGCWCEPWRVGQFDQEL